MKKLETINIKGKNYVLINERVKHFNETYPTGQILTEMLSNYDGICVFKATIVIDDKIKSVGHAYEREESSFINRTSYIENCETSAVGRALGFAGIGIDSSIATAEEVLNAINNQDKQEKAKSTIQKDASATKNQLEIIKKIYSEDINELKRLLVPLRKTKIEQLTIVEASNIIKASKKEEVRDNE